MIKNISFENYKSFKAEAKFELKPITIMIGPNSEGKSSLSRLIEILAQSFLTDQIKLRDENEGIVYNGRYTKQVNFENISWRRERDPVSIQFEVDIIDPMRFGNLPKTPIFNDIHPREPKKLIVTVKILSDYENEISINLTPVFKEPMTFKYDTKLRSIGWGATLFSRETKNQFSSDLYKDNKTFFKSLYGKKSAFIDEMNKKLIDKISQSILESSMGISMYGMIPIFYPHRSDTPKEVLDNIVGIKIPKRKDYVKAGLHKYFFKYINSGNWGYGKMLKSITGGVGIDKKNDDLINSIYLIYETIAKGKSEALQWQRYSEFLYAGGPKSMVLLQKAFGVRAAEKFLLRIIGERYLDDQLDTLRALEPVLRRIAKVIDNDFNEEMNTRGAHHHTPIRHYKKDQLADMFGDIAIGDQGMTKRRKTHLRSMTSPISKINRALNMLGLRYRVIAKSIQPILKVPGVDEIYSFKIEEIETGLMLDLVDVGYGLSQTIHLLFLLFMGNKKCKYLFEEPETGLHPKAQSKLADIFVQAFKNGSSFIIDTHSEHLVRELQVLVSKGKISNEDIAIYYVSKNPKGNSISKLYEIDKKGFIKDKWPSGFYDESTKLSLELWKSK